MNIKCVNEPGFELVGIAIRTTNKEAIEMGTIQKLWQKIFEEQILSKIQNKIDNSIIALYYDYDSNKDGAYNLLVGARVSSSVEIPEGMIAQSVPAAKRDVFVSEAGSGARMIFDLWKKIWLLEDQGRLNRVYEFDYELYDERSRDPKNAQMEIHIGVK